MMKEYLECGQIVSAHGLRGEVRVLPWGGDAQELASVRTFYYDDRGEKPAEVERIRVQKNMLLLKLAGVETQEAALALRGRVLRLRRADAPLAPGEYYVQDLLGMQVLDADSGVRYGELCDVASTGANDVYSVCFADGAVRLIPAIPQVVVSIDPAAGRMLIRPLPGLFED